jgi:hypothetical protein
LPRERRLQSGEIRWLTGLTWEKMKLEVFVYFSFRDLLHGW